MLLLRNRLAVALSIAIVLVGCGSSSQEDPDGDAAPASTTVAEVAPETTTAEPTAVEPTTELSTQLATVLEEFVGTNTGGVDVLFTSDGATQRIAVGTATADGEELRPGSSFRVGSISKPFIATMVLQLVDEGRVDLDTPLGEYLPDTPTGRNVTIRQLLSHQSGIANYTDQPTFFADVLEDPTRHLSPDDVLAYIAGAPPGPPDRFAYSNSNYILLGQLVERLDGTDINSALTTRILDPLGLDDTFFDTGDRALPANLVGGWSPGVFDGDPSATYTAIASSAWSAGALVSTTDDLAAFLAALAAGQLVSAESLQEMTTFGPAGYGLGLFRAALSTDELGWGHGGSIPGYSATMAISPLSGDTLVVLTNNDALIADLAAQQILTAR